MKRSILNKLAVIGIAAFVLLGLGCMARIGINKASVEKKACDNTKLDRLNAIRATQMSFNTLNIKGKVNFVNDHIQNDGTVTIRMQKDRVIWVSVTAFAGLEVIRAFITPDSIKILNRFENTYICKPFRFIHEFTNKRIDFQIMQSILVGNVISGWLEHPSEVLIQGDKTELSNEVNLLLYRLQFNEGYKLVQTHLNDKNTTQSLLIKYSDFATVAGKDIAKRIDILSQLDRKALLELNLRYTKIAIDETLTFPFTVPKRFSVTN